MSYAGPASRGQRAPNLQLSASQPIARAASGRWRAQQAPTYTSKRERTVAFAAGIALGLAAGAGLALLFAPQSGEEARRAIVRTGKRVGRRSRDAWDDLRSELRNATRRRKRARHDDTDCD